MADISNLIAPKSDQLNSDDLATGDRTIRITEVNLLGAGKEQPIWVHYEGDDGKPWKPCKTMARLLANIWQAPDTSMWAGRLVQLYRDPDVTWAGAKIGGIRIRAVSHIDAPRQVAISESKTKRKLATIAVLPNDAPHAGARPADPQARAFADKMLSAIARAPELDKLNTYIAGQQGKIDGLPDDMRAEVNAALSARRDALNDGTPFAGPADDQRGGASTADKDALRKTIDAADDRDAWEAAQAQVLAADLTDEDRLELTHALQVRQDALRTSA